MVMIVAGHAGPSRRRHPARATTASATGVNKTVAYFTASAAARTRPAVTRRAVRAQPGKSEARTPSHTASASRNNAIASKVAKAPRNCVPARVANNPVASSAALRP